MLGSETLPSRVVRHFAQGGVSPIIMYVICTHEPTKQRGKQDRDAQKRIRKFTRK